jgi:glycosyltransferase involved in cell wall biosynthesis
MKILLLTDIPPCENFTAGLVLEKLVRFFGPNELVLCSVVNPAIVPVVPKDLQSLPSLNLRKPREGAVRLLPGIAGAAIAFAFELICALRTRLLLPKIVKFAAENQVDAVWVILQGQTMIRLARPLSQKLHVPLFTQIWDPFGWWLRDNRIDRLTQKRLFREFDRAVQRSTACATTSWAMSEEFNRRYKTRNRPVIASMSRTYLNDPALQPHDGDDFIIGMAGQFYAQTEWNSLIQALNQVNWTIAGKRIRIRVMGAGLELASRQPANFEYLGWQSQEDTIRLLAESDLLYLPYWFSEEFKEEAATSFPSKLIAYFVSGRPVFCHAPEYASPSKYLALHDAGYLCTSLDSQRVLEILSQAIVDTQLYAKRTKAGTDCFLRDFTLERMKETFFDFLSKPL